jgi:hypothetical protein
MREPFDYPEILYNEVIDHLETKWNRKLDEHERSVLVEGYRFGRSKCRFIHSFAKNAT